MLEVELKFLLSDPDRMAAELARRGAAREAAIVQQDAYYNHPARDFEVTDEALRVRSTGDANHVTYKGPLLDPRTKTRHEIEVPLGDGADVSEQFQQVLNALGFRFARIVRKTRTPYRLDWEGRPIEIALDDVEGLGNYLEIETLAEPSAKDAARDSILRLAADLGLKNPERRAYLRLLMDNTSPTR